MSNNALNSRETPYRWVILTVVFVVQMCTSAQMCLSPLGPYIREGIGMNYTQFGLLFTAVNLGSVLVLMISGTLVDKTGIKKILLLSQICIGIVLIVASLADAPIQLLVLLFILGIIESTGGPMTSKAVGTWFSQKERATAMGIKQAGIPATGIVAGAVLPTVAATYGWRVGFVAVGAFVAAWGVISFVLYRDSDIMIAAKKKQTQKVTFREASKYVFTKDIVILSVGCSLLMGSQFVFTSYLTNYLSEIFVDIPAVAAPIVLAGTFYSICNIGGFIGRVGLGLISDKLFHGRRKGTLIAVCIIGTVILFLMSFLVPYLNIIGIAVIVFLFGTTGVSFTGIQLSMVSEMSGFKASGLSTGFTLALGFACMMLFSPLFGAIVDKTGDYFWGWITLGMLSAIGVILLLFVKENKKEEKSLQIN